jgi:hypothetical protein
MTPVFATRRRAEEFGALVQAPAIEGSADPRYGDLLRVVGTLRDTAPVTARPEFVADLRERLLTAADTALASTGAAAVPTELDRLTLPPRRSSRERRIAAAVGGLALVGATTSMAMAAQDALPGDALYPVKRAIENAQTGIQFGEGDKGVTLLANASDRLHEISALSEDASGEDTVMIADTLVAFSDQASAASDLLLSDYAQTGDQASITGLRDFTAISLEELTALEPQVPDAAQDELVRAAQLLVEIDAAAQQACPICAGSGITEIPRIFVPTSANFAVPDPTGSTAQAPAGQKPGAQPRQGGPSGGEPAVPTLDPGKLPSGSVLQPSPNPDPKGGQQPAPSNEDPIGDLADQLTNGGSTGTSNPASPDLGDVAQDVDDVVDGVGEVVDPITGEVLP